MALAEDGTAYVGTQRGEVYVAEIPVDLLVMPDGALLVSDDYAGKIYRIVYRGP